MPVTRRARPPLKSTVRYVWTDQEGVEHTTDAAGLPPELRGANGKPQLPPNHPVWEIVFDQFYKALNKAFGEKKDGYVLSREAYWWLWDNDRDKMLDLYRRWLGGRSENQ